MPFESGPGATPEPGQPKKEQLTKKLMPPPEAELDSLADLEDEIWEPHLGLKPSERKKAEQEQENIELRGRLAAELIKKETVAIEMGRALFRGHHWQNFIEGDQSLIRNLKYLHGSFDQLADKAVGKNKIRLGFDTLPPEILEAIVSPEYLSEVETKMTKLAAEHGGVYSAFRGVGSGDYFDWRQGDDGVTKIYLGDSAGHGVVAALLKAMVRRFIELREQDATANSEKLFPKIDELLDNLPCGGNQMEFLALKAIPTGEGAAIEIESTGGRVWVRRQISEGEWQVEKFEPAGWTLLGTGAASKAEKQKEKQEKEPGEEQKEGRIVNKLNLQAGDAILLFSDGFYDLSLKKDDVSSAEDLRLETDEGSPRFKDDLENFWAEHAHLPNEEFQQVLVETFRLAKREGRVDDDVTEVMYEVPAKKSA